jgi:hypothetical protein
MFKWKVSGLGGKKEKSPKQTARLNNDTSIIGGTDNVKNNKVKDNNNKKDK